jgi:WD40 repeat protein
MSEYNDPFFPQNVDESIEHLSSTRQSNTRGKQHVDANAHLIHDLDKFYGAEHKRHQQALQRVEDRLVRQYTAHGESSTATPSLAKDTAERQRIDLWETQRIRRVQKMKDKPSPFANLTSFGRSVGLLLVAVILVGSIVLVLNYAHQRTSIPGTLAPTNRATPTPPILQPTPTMSGPIGKTLYTTPANTMGFNGLSWSPDSKRVASSTINGVQIWDAVDGLNQIPALLPTDASEWPYGVDWSPNSQMVAIATNKHVLLVDGQSGKVIRSATPGATAMIQPVSSGISYLGSQFPDSGGFGYRATAWSPDGKQMASALSTGPTGTIQVWNPQTGTNIFTLTVDNTYNIGALAWSTDGQYIAASTWNTQMTDPNLPNNEIIAWKASTHQIVFRHKDNLSSSDAPVVWQAESHNLTFVGATISGGNMVSTLEIWNVDTARLIKQYAKTGTGTLNWSPDGKYLAYADFNRGTPPEVVVIRDMVTDKQIYVYKDHTHHINEIVWSPDGKYIASSEGNTQGGMVAKTWVAK